MSLAELSAGRKVQLTDNRHATIRYAGQTTFAPGFWIGIELEDASGKNDGSVQGERYFDCPMGHGMFVRPTTLKVLAEPPAPFMPQPAKKAARPSSMLSSASSRGSTPADPGLARRVSLNAPSPTPGQKPSRTPTVIRSPTKSPTKQLGTAPSSGAPSRTITPSITPSIAKAPPSRTTTPSNAKPPARGRPSVTAGRPSMAPPPMPAARPTRRVSAAPAPKPAGTTGPKTAGAPSRTPSGRVSTAKPGVARPSTIRHTSSSSQSGPDKTRPVGKRSSASSTASASKSSDDEILAPQPISPVQLKTMALEKLTASGTAATTTKHATTANKSPDTTKPPTGAKLPGAVAATSRTVSSTTMANKEIEDLKAKLRVLEKKRMEDREKLNTLEKTKGERDRFERIIQTLQIKYQPQQHEIADLKRQLKEAETRLHNVEEIQQDHETAMELATLDREMAEEMAEVYKAELDAVKQKSEELELEVEILREENSEFTKGMSPEDMASTGWLQMEKDNERLREALIRMRDLSREAEADCERSIKTLQEAVLEMEGYKPQLDACKEDLAQRDAAVEDLREQLDNALGAEDLIETLTEQNMNQSEEMKELKATISDLEDLGEVNNELQTFFADTVTEMQAEIDKRDAIIAEQAREAALQKKATEDMEYTLSRFRELVTSLQSDLEDMRASHAVTENESEQLNNRSRAMLDLNMKLQISAAKAQVKTIDLELRRMEAQEAEQHLEIVTMFLPDTYQTDRDSVLALLRFKRLASKANILSGFIKERNNQPHPGHENEVFEGCGAMDRLTWVSCMCDRFINSISHCSLEQFARYQGALYELEPVERALNGWIEGLKHDHLKEKQCSVELLRTIALMTHLGEVHISNDLLSFADDIHMKARLMQNHLESAAVSFAIAATMVQRVVTEDEEELGQHFTKKTEGVVTQTRSAKVIANKTVRALEDLKTRSLSLLPETLEAFEQCEIATAELADMARAIGLGLHEFLHEEGRTEAYTYTDIEIFTQTTATITLNSGDADVFSAYLNKLRIVTSQISDLAALSTDLTHTQEFERNQAPWILRSQELKVLKKIPVEAEAEARRLKDDLTNVRRTLAIREEDFSTAQLKIDTLESRMRDAKAKTTRIAELESQIDAAKEQAAALSDSIEKQDRELKTLESERDKWKQVADSSRIVAGSNAEGGEPGIKANQERAVATAREMDNLKTQIDALQDTVRYLREDNLRARMTEQPSYDWLAEPLTKNVPMAEQRKLIITAESRAVLGELVNLASSAKVFDMGSLPADKVAWKPAKSTPQHHAAKQMEEFGTWKGWQDAAVKKGKAVKGKSSAKVTVGVGEGSGRKSGPGGAKLQIRLR